MPVSVVTRTSPPAADLYFSGLPTGTVKLWVWRSWANTQSRVRGDDQTTIVGSEARIEDYDFPVNRAVSYYAQCFAADGSELTAVAASAPTTVNLPNTMSAWVSDPVAPSLAQLVELEGATDGKRSYGSNVTYAEVIGQRDAVAIGGIRSSATDWPFVFVSYTYETSNALELLFAGGGVLLIRAHPNVVRHITGLIYLSAPAIEENVRNDLVDPPNRSDWAVTGRQVRPPGLAVVAPTREYKNLRDENANYQAIVTRYASYLAALRG